MNESFIAYLWRYRLVGQYVNTESGDPVTIIHPGEPNPDSGPDFFNARLRIGETIWAGNVELHVRASEWYRHGHQSDPAYDQVILHVVYEADRPVYHSNGEPVQTLVVAGLVPPDVYGRYLQLMQNRQWIPCDGQIREIGLETISLWGPALLLERLEERMITLRQQLARTGYDWDELFFRHMASCFGFRINTQPFELLARSIPLKIIRKHVLSRFQLEALLYGQAGMLNRPDTDPYAEELSKEYLFLSRKYSLQPAVGQHWKFLRLRPSNFPTIRISQFAGFLSKSQARFSDLLLNNSPAEILDLLNIHASQYWDTHYLFNKLSVERRKSLGAACAGLLIINGVTPLRFLYALEKSDPAVREEALGILEQIAPEENSVIGRWNVAGIPATNAFQSQALLHLKHAYCDVKRCLECRIGAHLLAGKAKNEVE